MRSLEGFSSPEANSIVAVTFLTSQRLKLRDHNMRREINTDPRFVAGEKSVAAQALRVLKAFGQKA